MKRVGELYEVVVFTASVSKVCLDHITFMNSYTNKRSTATRSWTSSISTVLCITGSSAKAVTTTRVTT